MRTKSIEWYRKKYFAKPNKKRVIKKKMAKNKLKSGQPKSIFEMSNQMSRDLKKFTNFKF